MTKNITDTGSEFIADDKVRARYGGHSKMWIWRLERADPDFPAPSSSTGASTGRSPS